MRLVLALLAVALLAAEAGAQNSEQLLAQAEELIEAGEAQAAVTLLDQVAKQETTNARTFLLRSTAHFILGEDELGRRDLERSLKLDPRLRQAWLNRAALDISDQDYEKALEALTRAEQLDPTALDNHVNIGAVLILQGDLEAASERFRSHLRRNPGSADAFYLVASNYAMGGYAGLAMEHLQRAIILDEKTRLRARTDPNFSSLENLPRFQEVLGTDNYQLPHGSHAASRQFETAYTGSEGPLLKAVVDTLQLSGRPFDRRIEVTPDWALIWTDIRIKVTNTADGKGEVQISAPAKNFTRSHWRERSEEFFRQLSIGLHQRGGL